MLGFDNWGHTLEIISVGIGIATFLAGIVAVFIVWSRFKGLEATVELISKGNVELRQVNRDQQSTIQIQEHNFRAKMQEQNREHDAQIARLEHQLETLKSKLIDDIVKGVISVFQHYTETH